MDPKTLEAPLRWNLVPRPLCFVRRPRGVASEGPVPEPEQAYLALTEGADLIEAVAADTTQAEDGSPPQAALWRALTLAHPGGLLPARVLSRICLALEAAAVPLALASVPGETLLLFPAPLLGRALAALHQAGVTQAAT